MTSIANSPPDCKSPLLQLARMFAEVVLQLRLCELQFNSHFDEGSRTMAERARTYAQFHSFFDDVPGSVQWRVFMRICSHLFSLFGLVGHTMCLKLSCKTVMTWFPTAWLLPSSFYTPGSAADSTIASMIGVMKGARQALAASIRAPIPGVIYEDLPTSPAAFEAVQLLEVWRLLDLPEGFADDDPRVGYCRQAKAEIVSFFVRGGARGALLCVAD